MEFKDFTLHKLRGWIGDENLRWFKHLKGLTGTYSPVLRLNAKRKSQPAYPVHLREGMQIRNWMRDQEEFKDWNDHDYDNNWCDLIDAAVKKYL